MVRFVNKGGHVFEKRCVTCTWIFARRVIAAVPGRVLSKCFGITGVRRIGRCIVLKENMALDKVEEGAFERPVAYLYVLDGQIFLRVDGFLVDSALEINLRHHFLSLKDRVPSCPRNKALERVVLL